MAKYGNASKQSKTCVASVQSARLWKSRIQRHVFSERAFESRDYLPRYSHWLFWDLSSYGTLCGPLPELCFGDYALDLGKWNPDASLSDPYVFKPPMQKPCAHGAFFDSEVFATSGTLSKTHSDFRISRYLLTRSLSARIGAYRDRLPVAKRKEYGVYFFRGGRNLNQVFPGMLASVERLDAYGRRLP